MVQDIKDIEKALRAFITGAPRIGKYSLHRMNELMDFLGNPQDNLKVIHVAGTSGKTSTSYYIASLLKAANFKVGLTVSPHIEIVSERAQINLESVDSANYAKDMTYFLDIVNKSNIKPTYFEVLIAFAYWYFDKEKVDYAVIEVGLGGLLDATNVVNRSDKLCVITDIGLDHTEILGSSLSDIAYQKAGIIQVMNRVFMNWQDDEIISIIADQCEKKQAKLTVCDDSSIVGQQGILRLLPSFQKRNFQLAKYTVDYVLDRDGALSLKPEQINIASKVLIPARMEIFDFANKRIIIDGSHNPQKIGALVDSVLERFGDKSISLLVSFGANKEASVKDNITQLRRLTDKIIITEFHMSPGENKFAMSAEKIKAIVEEAGFLDIEVALDPKDALCKLKNDRSDVGLVTGSLYLASNLRKELAKI